MRNISLYIHIPYCVSKCRYCDFVSYVDDDRSSYIDAIKQELKMYSNNDYIIDTIYIGGGTPSILTLSEIESIIRCIYENYKCKIQEFTIECNPESLTLDKVVLYKELGITRLSIGVQSFDNKVLNAIGRAHNSYQAQDAIELAKSYYDNINVDLIVGLPEENEDSVINSVKRLIDYDIAHISVYSLILEKGTPLFNDVESNKVKLPYEDDVVDRYDYICELLEKNGYNHYEISNFAKADYQCKHNIGYWRLKEYIGIGVNANGYINRERLVNTSSITDYCKFINQGIRPLLSKSLISSKETEFEYIMLALRLSEGISIEDYNDRFKRDFSECYFNQLDELNNYLNISKNNISVKKEFFGILNSIILKFM